MGYSIIDTHLHFWEIGRFVLPEINNYPDLARDYTINDFEDASISLDIKKAIYMEVNLIQEQKYSEARYITEVAKDNSNPIAAAFIGGYPLSYSFRDYISLFKENLNIKGLRHVLHPQERPRGLCLEKDFLENINFLGSLGLMFSICIRPSELMDAVELARCCPHTTFILDHCGNPDPGIVNGSLNPEHLERGIYWHEKEYWYDSIYELSQLKNVICKISGLMVRCPKEEMSKADYIKDAVNHCLDSFGPDRVVFGSNWPVCTLSSSYNEWVETLIDVISDRSSQDRIQLLHDNAERLFSL